MGLQPSAMQQGKSEYEQMMACLDSLRASSESRDKYAHLQALIEWMQRELVDQATRCVSRDTFRELETLVDCLAQSSVSSDSYRQLENMVSSIAANVTSPDFINQAVQSEVDKQLARLFEQTLQVRCKLDSTESACERVRELTVWLSSNTTGGIQLHNTDVLASLSQLENIRQEHALYKHQLTEQMDNIKHFVATLSRQKSTRDSFNTTVSTLSEHNGATHTISISSADLTFDKDEDMVGEGGFCYVYRATYNKKRKVAVKRLKEDVRKVPKAYEDSLRKEVRCLKNLLHPNIVRFLGIVWEPGFHAIVMEYMANEDLMTFIDNHYVHPYAKTKLLCDAAQGISYLHWLPKHITHNDIKASNVLISDDIVAKVTDFGLAEWTSFTTEVLYGRASLNEQTPLKGATGSHRSPESWDDINSCTSKSDVYSFAILIWELYSERKPFANKSPLEIGLAVREGQRPAESQLLKDTPLAISQLMKLCWHQEPQQRPDMSTVVTTLRHLLSHADIQATVNDAIADILRATSDENMTAVKHNAAMRLSLTTENAGVFSVSQSRVQQLYNGGGFGTSGGQIRMKFTEAMLVEAKLYLKSVKMPTERSAANYSHSLAWTSRAIDMKNSCNGSTKHKTYITRQLSYRDAPVPRAHLLSSMRVEQLEFSVWGFHVLSVSNDGTQLLACGWRSTELFIYDVSTCRHISSVKVMGEVCDAAWTSQGHILCILHSSKKVVTISAVTGDVISQATLVSPTCVHVSNIDDAMYVADNQQGILQSVDGGLTWTQLFNTPAEWKCWQVVRVRGQLCGEDDLWVRMWRGESSVLRVYTVNNSTATVTWRDVKTTGNSSTELSLCSLAAVNSDDGGQYMLAADFKANTVSLLPLGSGQEEQRVLLTSSDINSPYRLAVCSLNKRLFVGQKKGLSNVFQLSV